MMDLSGYRRSFGSQSSNAPSLEVTQPDGLTRQARKPVDIGRMDGAERNALIYSEISVLFRIRNIAMAHQ